MNYWFTSDLHFNHKKIIEYAKRPFLSAEGQPDVAHMNETMITLWNETVMPDDHIYILGDIACGGTPEGTYEIVRRLAGRKYLVYGNHDKEIRKSGKLQGLFEWCRDLTEVKIPSDPTNLKKTQSIVLCHYAMRVWNKSHYGAWQLYGHSHGNLTDDPHALQLDVGVDNWDFHPVSFAEIQEVMRTKTWKPVDHHGKWPPSPDSKKCGACGQINFLDNKTCGNCGTDFKEVASGEG